MCVCIHMHLRVHVQKLMCVLHWYIYQISTILYADMIDTVVMLCPVQAMGVVMKMSDAVLGLTLLAWGNSIGGEGHSNACRSGGWRVEEMYEYDFLLFFVQTPVHAHTHI